MKTFQAHFKVHFFFNTVLFLFTYKLQKKTWFCKNSDAVYYVFTLNEYLKTKKWQTSMCAGI